MRFVVRFILNYAIALDQLINTLLLGHCDETVSSRLGRTIGRERYFWVKPLRLLVDSIFFFDYTVGKDGKKRGHCESSVMPLEQQSFRTVTDYELWSWVKED